MGPKPDKTPLIAVVGETASGKSALALELARIFNAEIIAADSRTLYQGMDIGTAKPTLAERQLVPHHLIDIAKPDHPIFAPKYKQLALAAIADISSRGTLPLLVGGSGLYVDAVLLDYHFAAKPEPDERKYLQGLSVEELQRRLREQGIPLPTNERNPRHLVRQLEGKGQLRQHGTPRPNTLILGMQLERDELVRRVRQRTNSMLASGLEQEVRSLVAQYGWCRSLETIGYQEFRPYFNGECTLQDVRDMIVRNTIRYAKRQRTWFKRNKNVRWICKKDEAVDLVTTLLNK